MATKTKAAKAKRRRPKHRRDPADGVVAGKKRCRRCGKRKPVAGKVPCFYKDKDTADGYRDYCKPCEKRMNEKYKAKSAKKSKRNGKTAKRTVKRTKAAKRRPVKPVVPKMSFVP